MSPSCGTDLFTAFILVQKSRCPLHVQFLFGIETFFTWFSMIFWRLPLPTNLGSDWGQACLIKYKKTPFVQSSTKICILKKTKIPTILKSDKFQLSCKGLQCPVLTAPASHTELPAHIPKFTPPATSCFRKLSRTQL